MDGLQAGDPHPGRFLIALGFVAFLALEIAFLGFLRRAFAVAMVAFVVERQDALHAHQFRQHPLQHLAFRLLGLQRRAVALQQHAAASRQRHVLAADEGVVVGDDDGGALQVRQHVLRHQLAGLVVAVRVVRLQHPQPFADSDARRDHEEASREAAAAGMPYRIHRLPRDEHSHHGGLAGAGGQLQREAREPRIGAVVGAAQVRENVARFAAKARCHFGEPDHRLCGFHLAEERADAAEGMVPPVLQQPCGLRRHPPLLGRQPAPSVELSPQGVDVGVEVVALPVAADFGRSPVEHHLCLLPPLSARFGHRRDERRGPAAADALVGRMSAVVQLPVLARPLVGRVQDGLIVEIDHAVG